MDKNGSQWIKWVKMDKNGSQWIKWVTMDKNGSKWIKIGHFILKIGRN
jgi:hypothetical protein